MKGPPSKMLSVAAVQKLLATTSHVVDAELSEYLRVPVCVFRDGKLLVPLGGRGRLYHSAQAARAFLLDGAESHGKPCSIAGTYLPQGRSFAEQVDDLATQVPALLRVDPRRLDFELGSLKVIDRALRKIPVERLLGPELCPPLIAYGGEVMRRRVGGSWEMRPDAEAWEPWIIAPGGREFAPFLFVKELDEFGRHASTQAFVESSLGAYPLP